MPIAVIVYAVVIGVAAAMQLAVWLWASHRRRLVVDGLSEQERLRISFGLGGATFAFLIAIPVAPFSTTAAQLCWLIALVPTDRLAELARPPLV